MKLLNIDYTYTLEKVLRVIDGDTIECEISRDAGFYLTNHWKLRIRLNGINCPELKGSSKLAGQQALEFTKKWLEGQPCIVETIAKSPGSVTGQTSFERWIANIKRGDGSSLADALVESGHAVRTGPVES